MQTKTELTLEQTQQGVSDEVLIVIIDPVMQSTTLPSYSRLDKNMYSIGMHIFIGNFTYVADFMIVEDISSIIDPRLSQVVLGKPFVEISNMTHDLSLGVVKFTDGINEIAYKMPHKIEKYNSLSDLEKEHTKSVYLRNEEDKKRGVELYLMRRNPKVLRKFQEDDSWRTI
ncbi:hypothetical protein Tco_0798990 [Tanacetum coccineum]